MTICNEVMEWEQLLKISNSKNATLILTRFLGGKEKVT